MTKSEQPTPARISSTPASSPGWRKRRVVLHTGIERETAFPFPGQSTGTNQQAPNGEMSGRIYRPPKRDVEYWLVNACALAIRNGATVFFYCETEAQAALAASWNGLQGRAAK
jgi:hypothetical protein